MKRHILKLALFLTLITSTVFGAGEVYSLFNQLNVNYRLENRMSSSTLAYYEPDTDRIHLRKNYSSPAVFNHTALHELGHWARADHRLGPISGTHRVPNCYEEIVVEIAGAVMADLMDLPRTSFQQMNYYIEGEIPRRLHISPQSWEMLFFEVKQTVDYILNIDYPVAELTQYFNNLPATDAIPMVA